MIDKIIFNEDSESVFPRESHASHGLVARLIAWRIVKDERGANYILLGIVALCITIMVMLLTKVSSSAKVYGNYDMMRATHPELFQNNPPPVR